MQYGEIKNPAFSPSITHSIPHSRCLHFSDCSITLHILDSLVSVELFFCSITLAFSLIRLWLYTIFSVSRPAPKGGQHPRPPFRQTVKTRKGEITKKTGPAGHYSTCIPPLSASGPASPPPGEPLAPRRCAGSPKSPGCTSHPPVGPRHATSVSPSWRPPCASPTARPAGPSTWNSA